MTAPPLCIATFPLLSFFFGGASIKLCSSKYAHHDYADVPTLRALQLTHSRVSIPIIVYFSPYSKYVTPRPAGGLNV